MGSGVEASTAAPSSGRALQPAFGQYVDYPEQSERAECETEECEADRFARRIKWPALFALAALEATWLGALLCLIYRLIV